MQREWKDNNVDLSVLADFIVMFWKDNYFETSVIKSENYHIIARPQPFLKIVENIHIFVSGRPNDFSIRFESGMRSRSFVKYGTITSLFGGGFIAVRGLKSEEKIYELEDKFWPYVHEVVNQLTNSASEMKT